VFASHDGSPGAEAPDLTDLRVMSQTGSCLTSISGKFTWSQSHGQGVVVITPLQRHQELDE